MRAEGVADHTEGDRWDVLRAGHSVPMGGVLASRLLPRFITPMRTLMIKNLRIKQPSPSATAPPSPPQRPRSPATSPPGTPTHSTTGPRMYCRFCAMEGVSTPLSSVFFCFFAELLDDDVEAPMLVREELKDWDKYLNVWSKVGGGSGHDYNGQKCS